MLHVNASHRRGVNGSIYPSSLLSPLISPSNSFLLPLNTGEEHGARNRGGGQGWGEGGGAVCGDAAYLYGVGRSDL